MPAPGGCIDPLNWAGCAAGGVAKSVGNSIFDQLANWWSDAFKSMMDAFSKAFLHAGDVSISQFQGSGLWKLEVAVGATIAAGSMIWAGARSAWTRTGDAIATALTGLVKAVLGTAMVFTIVTVLMGVADGLTQAIMTASAGNTDNFASKLSQLSNLAGLSGSSALVFFFGLLGVIIIAVLWVEMLIRAAGIVIVTVSTPIGAGGLVNEHTASWWKKMVSAELALIFIKPIVALVLAVGFTVATSSTGVQGVIVGFMILATAAIAWPVITRLFSFFEAELAGHVLTGHSYAGGLATSARSAVGSRSNGSQPMWQSMEQASSRGGGGSSPLGTPGGPSNVGTGGRGGAPPFAGGAGLGADVAGGGGGAAAASAGGSAGVASMAGPVALAMAADKAARMPGQALGRSADMAGMDAPPRDPTLPPPPPPPASGSWTNLADAPPEPPPPPPPPRQT